MLAGLIVTNLITCTLVLVALDLRHTNWERKQVYTHTSHSTPASHSARA